MQLSYDWPGQDVGFFAVGLLGAEWGEGEEFERACKDSSERASQGSAGQWQASISVGGGRATPGALVDTQRRLSGSRPDHLCNLQP